MINHEVIGILFIVPVVFTRGISDKSAGFGPGTCLHAQQAHTACRMVEYKGQGPFEVEMKTFNDCSNENDTTLLKLYTKLKRDSRKTMLVGGTVVLNETFDNNFKLKLYADKESSQGWAENYFFTDFQGKGACDIFNEFAPADTKRLFAAMKKENCPIPPGVYEVAPMALGLQSLTSTGWSFYGKYRIRFVFHHPNFSSPPVGCTLAIDDVVPKKTNALSRRT